MTATDTTTDAAPFVPSPERIALAVEMARLSLSYHTALADALAPDGSFPQIDKAVSLKAYDRSSSNERRRVYRRLLDQHHDEHGTLQKVNDSAAFILDQIIELLTAPILKRDADAAEELTATDKPAGDANPYATALAALTPAGDQPTDDPNRYAAALATLPATPPVATIGEPAGTA